MAWRSIGSFHSVTSVEEMQHLQVKVNIIFIPSGNCTASLPHFPSQRILLWNELKIEYSICKSIWTANYFFNLELPFITKFIFHCVCLTFPCWILVRLLEKLTKNKLAFLAKSRE